MYRADMRVPQASYQPRAAAENFASLFTLYSGYKYILAEIDRGTAAQWAAWARREKIWGYDTLKPLPGAHFCIGGAKKKCPRSR